MQDFFGLLSVICFFCLIFGLVNPKIVIRWGNKKTRAQVFFIYGSLAIVFFILAGATAPMSRRIKTGAESRTYTSDNDINKYFNKLDFVNIKQISSDEIKFVVETDLSNGLEFFASIQKPGMKPNDKYIGTDSERIKVKNGQLEGTIKMYFRNGQYLPKGDYQLKLYTGSQWYFNKERIKEITKEEKDIYKKIGKYGENIRIPPYTKKLEIYNHNFNVIEATSESFLFPSQDAYSAKIKKNVKKHATEKRKAIEAMEVLEKHYKDLIKKYNAKKRTFVAYEIDWGSWSKKWNQKLETIKKKYFEDNPYVDEGYYKDAWSNLNISAGYLFTIWSDLHFSLMDKVEANLNSDIIQYYKEGMNEAKSSLNAT